RAPLRAPASPLHGQRRDDRCLRLLSVRRAPRWLGPRPTAVNAFLLISYRLAAMTIITAPEAGQRILTSPLTTKGLGQGTAAAAALRAPLAVQRKQALCSPRVDRDANTF